MNILSHFLKVRNEKNPFFPILHFVRLLIAINDSMTNIGVLWVSLEVSHPWVIRLSLAYATSKSVLLAEGGHFPLLYQNWAEIIRQLRFVIVQPHFIVTMLWNLTKSAFILKNLILINEKNLYPPSADVSLNWQH